MAKYGINPFTGKFDMKGDDSGSTGVTVSGDSGSMTGTSLKIFANKATRNCGSTVSFVNTGTTSTLNVTANNNTCIGQGSGNLTMVTAGNTCIGSQCAPALTTGQNNTFLGATAGTSLTTGNYNIGIGSQTLTFNILGEFNVALGGFSLRKVSGSGNVGLGYSSGSSITSGTMNTCLGHVAGELLDTTDSNNICIGANASGSGGVSNRTVIGNGQTTCFISGISGATVTGTAVLCATNGQLGTIASSRKYKENIVDMPEMSILNLRPVKFNYISDVNKNDQYGLIAEEVEKDFPYLCFYKDGNPESVKYHELPVFLLKEIQKLEKRIKLLENAKKK